jgi:hypothetical protein
MTDYLANGKADKNKVHLAALQKKCWEPIGLLEESGNTYGSVVMARLSHEFGSESRISNNQQLQQIIEAYRADGVQADKAADYIVAKIKWGPKNDAEIAVQRELAKEFAKYGVDFMTIDPEVHFSILQEAIVFKRIPQAVERFFAIAEEIGRDDRNDSAMLIDVYRNRLEILHGGNRADEAAAMPLIFKRFI